jgi:hypothetical protein
MVRLRDPHGDGCMPTTESGRYVNFRTLIISSYKHNSKQHGRNCCSLPGPVEWDAYLSVSIKHHPMIFI